METDSGLRKLRDTVIATSIQMAEDGQFNDVMVGVEILDRLERSAPAEPPGQCSEADRRAQELLESLELTIEDYKFQQKALEFKDNETDVTAFISTSQAADYLDTPDKDTEREIRKQCESGVFFTKPKQPGQRWRICYMSCIFKMHNVADPRLAPTTGA